MRGTAESGERGAELLAPLTSDPSGAAILCDLDGTLAPIVERAGEAAIPERARQALSVLAERYALCAVVTGRRAADARRIVGLDELTYIGIHGFELLRAREEHPRAAAALRGREEEARRFASRLRADELDAAGVRTEEKGPIAALHWRGAPDEEAAEALVARIGEAARSSGLVTHAGRKVLELRPPVAIDKGVAVAELLSPTPLRTALYAGDDRTDLDAFRSLGELRERGELATVVRVGVRSPEEPDGLAAASDLLVADTDELLGMLEALAR